ncbi:uncharacterized protein [Nicotiana sylvestris]|uniref:uncharacterized protein n=1 Tax=Nicotiana sylvestris TaxID=4096 RepID=UPI00388C9C7F
MMRTEDKALFCFCHWGWASKELPDGSTSYVGGITRQFNDGSAHVYASSLEKEPNSRQPSGGPEKVERSAVSDSEPDTTSVRDDENDLASPLKKAQSNQSTGDSKPQQKEDVGSDDQKQAGVTRPCSDFGERLNQDGVGLPEGDVQNNYSKVGTVNKQASRTPSSGTKKVELIVDSVSTDSDSEPNTTPAADDVNDLASPLKKARFQSAGDSRPQQKEDVGGDGQKHTGVTRSCSNSVERLDQNGVGLPEGDVQNNSSKIVTVNDQASGQPSGVAKGVELTVDSDSEPNELSDSNPSEDDYLYPEFTDFDKYRSQDCFAVDQIWACYDTDDEMPRCYTLIKQVSSPEFRIKLRWLEPRPEYPREHTWVRSLLPVGCGRFKCGGAGSIEYTSDLRLFSHEMQWFKGKGGPYFLYPRKGETWALFKDWDFSWTCDPRNHREYKYEVVEILSDYVYIVGLEVGYLDKVIGFDSLFQRTRPTVVDTFFIHPKDYYKFSHRIPSFKMTGAEGEGVPAGSFELDFYALPPNPDDIWYPGKDKEDSRTANSEPLENVECAVPSGTIDKSRTPENATTSLECGNLEGIHATDRESSMQVDLELRLWCDGTQ